MRLVMTLMVISGFAVQAAAAQSEGTAATDQQAVRACSLLTRELLEKITPEDRERFEFGLRIPAFEEPVGVSGSMCEYGGVLLQINPFASPARVEEMFAGQWTSISGVGDIAYFRDNSGEWGELYVRAGKQVITIQMDIPAGHTAESIKPNLIALANAILPELS